MLGVVIFRACCGCGEQALCGWHLVMCVSSYWSDGLSD